MKHAFSLGAGGIALLAASHAFANPLEYSNDTGGSVLAYGQLSPAYLSFDDGSESYGDVVDNANSNSRVGLYIDQEMGSVGFRFHFETSLGAPQSSKFSQDVTPIWNWEKTDLRKLEMIFDGSFGKLYLGQGSMATDGVAERDLSKTTIAGYVNRPDTAGGYFFREENGDLSDISIIDTFTDYDGSRRMRIRYDTPSFSGFTFRAAYGYEALKADDDSTYYDAAISYTNDVGDFSIDGAAGFHWTDNPDTDETVDTRIASVSVLHVPTGLNGTIAGGSQPDNGNYLYGKFGWIGGFLDVGYTALSVDYYGGSDFAVDGSSSDSWGLQAVQKFDDWNLEAYLAYAQYKLDDDKADYKDPSSTLVGVRWKF